jgi:hypothetical protein
MKFDDCQFFLHITTSGESHYLIRSDFGTQLLNIKQLVVFTEEVKLRGFKSTNWLQPFKISQTQKDSDKLDWVIKK